MWMWMGVSEVEGEGVVVKSQSPQSVSGCLTISIASPVVPVELVDGSGECLVVYYGVGERDEVLWKWEVLCPHELSPKKGTIYPLSE